MLPVITFQTECLMVLSSSYIQSPVVRVLRDVHLVWKKEEGNVLFNDALNTFYLRLYGVRHMVKDHSDSERGNPMPSHGLLFLINCKGYFICTIPQAG